MGYVRGEYCICGVYLWRGVGFPLFGCRVVAEVLLRRWWGGCGVHGCGVHGCGGVVCCVFVQYLRASGRLCHTESKVCCAVVGLAAPVCRFQAWRSVMPRICASACTAVVVVAPAVRWICMNSAGVILGVCKVWCAGSGMHSVAVCVYLLHECFYV